MACRMAYSKSQINGKSKIIWPEVFIDPSSVTYTERSKAIADGLVGWANCRITPIGEDLPEMFGMGMVKIGDFLGYGSTANRLNKEADEIISAKKGK